MSSSHESHQTIHILDIPVDAVRTDIKHLHLAVYLPPTVANDRFRDLMDHFMPQWQLHRAELNRAPLAHEDWAS